MKKGVIYARFSSKNQREESIEQQVDECRWFAEKNGIEIVEVYADRAVSGRTDKRVQFQRMMRDAEKKAFECVLAYKSNRIARNMLNALQYEDKLAKLGIETFYAKEEYGNNPTGRFALRMMMNLNQFYSENLSEDIKRGMLDNAQKGKVNGSLPLGYKKGEDGRYAIDEEKAALVREIYQRTKDGESFTDIAADLNARGLKTKTGGAWNKGSFHHMLTNDVYTGIYRHSGIEIKGAVPPIISTEDFEEMQEFLHSKRQPIGRHRGDADYLLTGILFCGHCGKPMVGTSATSKTGKLHYYYICKGRQKKLCDKKTITKDYIEELVCSITRDQFMTDDIIKWVSHAVVDLQEEVMGESDLPLLKEQLEEDEKALSNLIKAIADGVHAKSIASEISRLEDEIDKLKRQIENRESAELFTEEDFIELFEDFRNGDYDDPSYRKHVIDSFVQKVTLWDDEIEVEYYPTGAKNESVRIRSNTRHHTLTVQTYVITVSTEKISVKERLPSV